MLHHPAGEGIQQFHDGAPLREKVGSELASLLNITHVALAVFKGVSLQGEGIALGTAPRTVQSSIRADRNAKLPPYDDIKVKPHLRKAGDCRRLGRTKTFFFPVVSAWCAS